MTGSSPSLNTSFKLSPTFLLEFLFMFELYAYNFLYIVFYFITLTLKEVLQAQILQKWHLEDL